jgi:hypothetical protein
MAVYNVLKGMQLIAQSHQFTAASYCLHALDALEGYTLI